MKSTQDKFFEQLQRHLDDKAKGELVVDTAWANQGRGYVQDKDSFYIMSEFSYDFQMGYATFTVNGESCFARFSPPRTGKEKDLEDVIHLILAPVPDPDPLYDTGERIAGGDPACPRR